MGRHYSQLSLEERCTIAHLYKDGQSVREIAANLDRAPSTVARELKRNRGTQLGYKPSYAHEQARARRWTGSRLDRDAGLRGLVLGQLRLGWSPEQLAAARLTGGGHNAFSRYERGEAAPLPAVVNLFRLLDKHPELLKDLD